MNTPEHTHDNEILSEHTPTIEEVHTALVTLVDIGKRSQLIQEGAVAMETRRTIKEDGLYELDIEIQCLKEGEKIGYEYRRFNPPHVPGIHALYYKGDMPISGELVANYVDGEWMYL